MSLWSWVRYGPSTKVKVVEAIEFSIRAGDSRMLRTVKEMLECPYPAYNGVYFGIRLANRLSRLVEERVSLEIYRNLVEDSNYPFDE